MHESRPSQDPSLDVTEATLLAGRTALVAGGTGNVGRHLVVALLERGATVVVPSRSAERLRALRAAVAPAYVDRLLGIQGDLGDETKAVELGEAVRSRGHSLHMVVASLGRFVAAPSVLEAPLAELRAVLESYLVAHFLAARTLIPLVEPGGSYTFINGPLAFGSHFEGTGLVSIATAAQAMLARIVMDEARRVRVNEVVLYTPFGWGDRAPVRAALAPDEVARYVAYLASPRGDAIGGRTIHLDSPEVLHSLQGSPGTVAP